MAKGYNQSEVALEMQTRVGYGTRTDGQAVYEGYAGPRAAEADAEWVIKKNYYSSTDDNASFVGSVFAKYLATGAYFSGATGIPTSDARFRWSDLANLSFPSVTGGY